MSMIANVLTCLRIALAPAFVAAYWQPFGNAELAFWIFVIAALTDAADGIVARKTASVTSFGRALDPVADKLLVAMALMMLTAHQIVTSWLLIPALIIMGREFFVSGLRATLDQLKVSPRVAFLARAKTALQMAALALLIVSPSWRFWNDFVFYAGAVGLWLAAVVTLYTGSQYLVAALTHPPLERKPETPHASTSMEVL